MERKKTVLLCVTGGIAAYKIATLASMLVKTGYDVKVVMTQNATNFINPLVFETLTQHKCLIDTFDRNFEYSVEHVTLAKWADIVMIAPATANVIGKLAHGIADDMLTTTVMACAECKKILVTAGPTREAIDPVRYITNHSSGKMGYALARVATARGADVTLVTGPTEIKKPMFVKIVPVTTAKEMFEAVKKESADADIVCKAAAVADYRPKRVADEKVKKSDSEMSLELEKTDDILKYLGEHRKDGQFLCGFSMETENMVENSRKKLEKKNLDMIAANNLKVAGAGFQGDTNQMTLITKEDETALPLISKEETAACILDKILECINK